MNKNQIHVHSYQLYPSNHRWGVNTRILGGGESYAGLIVYTKYKDKIPETTNKVTHFWILEGGANTPYLGLHVKYRFPLTEPSFFPTGRSNSIPYHKPARNKVTKLTKIVNKRKHSILLFLCSHILRINRVHIVFTRKV